MAPVCCLAAIGDLEENIAYEQNSFFELKRKGQATLADEVPSPK